jgi:hypothetical protein
VTASLFSLALVGCTAQSLSPSQRAYPANQTRHAIHAESGSVDQSQTITLRWNPTSIKLTDGGPYVATSLSYTHGDTVVVSYDRECNYRVEFDLHQGPVKHNIETDGYDFYAYSGKSGSPTFHCNISAQLKNVVGHVIAHADIAVTITYPWKYGHGG